MDDERRETPPERDDRNFAELLQELRVTQTGVQVLFAFLLTLAFTQRFTSLDDVQRATYVVTLLLAMLAAALLTAPAAVHRALFRRHAKHRTVAVSSRLASVGLVVLALAFTGAVLLVVDVVLGRGWGIAAAAGTLAVCAGLWAVLPWAVTRHLPQERVTGRAGATEE
jgi:O-antigen/teichoic acid export membrane protein